MSMRDDIASAIAVTAIEMGVRLGGNSSLEDTNIAKEFADAVLKEMRKPTDAMLWAGAHAYIQNGSPGPLRELFPAIWKAMISEASAA